MQTSQPTADPQQVKNINAAAHRKMVHHLGAKVGKGMTVQLHHVEVAVKDHFGIDMCGQMARLEEPILKSLEIYKTALASIRQLDGASFDELRIGDFGRTQSHRAITELNMLVTAAARRLALPLFDISMLQSHPLAKRATIDGIHFHIGTGVNEAAVQLLLNRMC